MKDLAVYILVCLLTVLACFFAFKACDRANEPEDKPVAEHIIYIRDTLTVHVPLQVTRKIVDTVRLIVTKTQIDTVHDTVYVWMPIENVVWTDSLCSVYAHGVMTEIDSVRHYNESKLIYPETNPRPKRWGIGIQAGYGASKDGLTPYLGFGISYAIVRF